MIITTEFTMTRDVPEQLIKLRDEIIRRAVVECHGNMAEASRITGFNRATIGKVMHQPKPRKKREPLPKEHMPWNN